MAALDRRRKQRKQPDRGETEVADYFKRTLVGRSACPSFRSLRRSLLSQ